MVHCTEELSVVAVATYPYDCALLYKMGEFDMYAGLLFIHFVKSVMDYT